MITEEITCPYCGVSNSRLWAKENTFQALRCNDCSFIYCSPRPSEHERELSTQLGVHLDGNMNISERRVSSKVDRYTKIINEMFPELRTIKTPISWIDIGAGYGEVVEAVSKIAPIGSSIVGIEPMQPKAIAAQKSGLNIIQGLFGMHSPKSMYGSLINVFSHIYDFDSFLSDVHSVILPGGYFLIETGDMSHVKSASDIPSELGLPDHVAFASQKHLEGFLYRNGFQAELIKTVRIDTYERFVKNLIKCSLGKKIPLQIPYTSPYRSILIKAKRLN